MVVLSNRMSLLVSVQFGFGQPGVPGAGHAVLTGTVVEIPSAVMVALPNSTSVMIGVHFGFGQSAGEAVGAAVVTEKTTLPFLSLVNVPVPDSVPVCVWPGAMWP